MTTSSEAIRPIFPKCPLPLKRWNATPNFTA